MPLSSSIRPNHEVLFWRQLFNLLYIDRESTREEIFEEIDKLKLLLGGDSTAGYDLIARINETEDDTPLTDIGLRVYALARDRSKTLCDWINAEDTSVIISLGILTYTRYQNRMKPSLQSLESTTRLTYQELKARMLQKKLKDLGALDYQLGEKADQEFLALPFNQISANLLSYSLQIGFEIYMSFKYKVTGHSIGDKRLFAGYVLYELQLFNNLEEGIEYYKDGRFNQFLRDRVASYEGTISKNMKNAQISLEDITGDLVEEFNREFGEVRMAILFGLWYINHVYVKKA